MTDVLIIGSGPAGISAALYTLRAGFKTTIIARDFGSLGKAEKIENYYGFASPIEGTALAESGIFQAKRLGGEVITDEVVSISYNGKLVVATSKAKYEAETVILATGSTRNTPNIEGLARFEGHGVSYCAVCDGFFYRGKDVAVLGSGEYALHEASELLPIVKSVTLLTNAKELKTPAPAGIIIDTRQIASFDGSEIIERVVFKNGETLDISGLFVAVGVAGSADFAKKLGAQTSGAKILVDENMATNVPGLYAAGDCTGGILQIAKAVYDGAKAAAAVIKLLRSKT